METKERAHREIRRIVEPPTGWEAQDEQHEQDQIAQEATDREKLLRLKANLIFAGTHHTVVLEREQQHAADLRVIRLTRTTLYEAAAD